MNRSVALMLLVLGAILVGAVVLKRTLVATAEQEVVASKPAPTPAPLAVRPPPAPEPGSLIPPPPLPVAELPAAPSAAPAAGQRAPAEAEGAPEPLNPFTADDSREVEYAFQLVVGPNSTVDTAKNAAEVFERCLKQFPKNARCYQGLVAAQQRQQMPNWRPPGAPTPLAEGQAPGPTPPLTRPFPRPTFGGRRVIAPPPASSAPTE